MVKNVDKFESCHPDNETSVNTGVSPSSDGALGASVLFGFACQSLNHNKMIKSVKIKDSGSRWYVEYREFIAESNSWKRVREYGQVNREKNLGRRRELINYLAAEVMASLSKRVKATYAKNEIAAYCNAYLDFKAKTLRKTSMKAYRLALDYFQKYLSEKALTNEPLHAIRKRHISEFVDWITEKVGNRSVNGHLSIVRSFFNHWIKNYDDILFKNPCDGVTKLPTASETHVAYTNSQMRQMFAYMAENDPALLLYCQFVGLGFIRCKETTGLRVGDIDFSRKTITVSAGNSKTRRRKTKPVLDYFMNKLIEAEVYKAPPSFYVFTISGKPGKKPVGINHFRKRFAKVKKKFGLRREHTIYSFRHTFVSQMLDNGAKWHEAMKYTGHDTMESFAKYARSLHVKPAEDLSRFIQI